MCGFQRFTVRSLKVSLSLNIISNYVPRWQFRAQYRTGTTPQAGQVTSLHFSSLWRWGQTKWYVCHTPLPLEQNLVLLLQLNSARFPSRYAKWNQCLGFPGWAWRSQPLYHFSALSFLARAHSLQASNWHTADWKQHASEDPCCTILQSFGAPSFWFPLLFLFFCKLQISFVCVLLQSCEAKAKAYPGGRAGNKTREHDFWQLPIRSFSLHRHLDVTYESIVPNNKWTFNVNHQVYAG